jgi:hypothetical protein
VTITATERAIRRQWRYPVPRTSVRQLREQEPTAREIKANEAFRRGRQSAPPLQPPQGVSIAVDTNVKVEFFRNSSGSLAKFAAIRRASSFVSSLAASLFVPAKDVPDAGSYGEHAQCFMCSQSFSDPRRVLSEDMQLLWSSRPVPEESG